MKRTILVELLIAFRKMLRNFPRIFEGGEPMGPKGGGGGGGLGNHGLLPPRGPPPPAHLSGSTRAFSSPRCAL